MVLINSRCGCLFRQSSVFLVNNRIHREGREKMAPDILRGLLFGDQSSGRGKSHRVGQNRAL